MLALASPLHAAPGSGFPLGSVFQVLGLFAACLISILVLRRFYHRILHDPISPISLFLYGLALLGASVALWFLLVHNFHFSGLAGSLVTVTFILAMMFATTLAPKLTMVAIGVIGVFGFFYFSVVHFFTERGLGELAETWDRELGPHRRLAPGDPKETPERSPQVVPPAPEAPRTEPRRPEKAVADLLQALRMDAPPEDSLRYQVLSFLARLRASDRTPKGKDYWARFARILMRNSDCVWEGNQAGDGGRTEDIDLSKYPAAQRVAYRDLARHFARESSLADGSPILRLVSGDIKAFGYYVKIHGAEGSWMTLHPTIDITGAVTLRKRKGDATIRIPIEIDDTRILLGTLAPNPEAGLGEANAVLDEMLGNADSWKPLEIQRQEGKGPSIVLLETPALLLVFRSDQTWVAYWVHDGTSDMNPSEGTDKTDDAKRTDERNQKQPIRIGIVPRDAGESKLDR